ncbi:MAG TPA: SMI1/KNR4 family protein [Chitinophaga sp.]|uniref:SMI1/KNR4 family protein n=1 Tax=Chitinophaga sp. TaxID=1869181 RepID=UPI002DBA7C41|nr:SMI1/KNR4 family protein [Chitinophaga sp.]HEU4553655.1 SMI1/KNR4 family protein [Chitinophaga sp.]
MPITITDIISKIAHNKAALGIMLYGSASTYDISSFEREMGITLPDDIKTFYNFCNGFESNEDLFRIIPLAEITEERNSNYLVRPGDFHIAEYMVYCDMWSITIAANDPNKYSIYNKTDSVVTLTNSFSEFLDKFLAGGVYNGLYEWRAQIENNAWL